MAYYFGASMATDVFVAAFRIPNLLRDLFAEGALSSAFVPVFKEKLVNENDSEAFCLARIVLTSLLVVVGTLVLLGMVAAPALVFITANGFTENPVKFDLTISLTRIMFVYLLLVSLSAAVMGILNSFGRFGIPALSPALFNLGIIVTVVGLYHWLDVPVYALAIGVVIGGLGQLAVQLPQLWRIGFRFRFCFSFLDDNFKKVVRLVLPMVAGMSASRVNILISTLLASFLMEGALSFLNYSFRLMHFPLGVFAVALGTAALPRASELAARRDMDGLGRAYAEAINLNMFLVVPSAVFLAVMGRELVEVVFRWGAFSETDAANTTLALLHYSYGLIGFAAVRVTVPIYYALRDSVLPMRISIATVAINIALYYPLMEILDFAGLAAATSIAGLINFGLLLYYLSRKQIPIRYGSLMLGFFRIAAASSLGVWAATLIPVGIPSGWPEAIQRLLEFGAHFAGACVFYLILCFVMRVSEARLLLRRLIGRT